MFQVGAASAGCQVTASTATRPARPVMRRAGVAVGSAAGNAGQDSGAGAGAVVAGGAANDAGAAGSGLSVNSGSSDGDAAPAPSGDGDPNASVSAGGDSGGGCAATNENPSSSRYGYHRRLLRGPPHRSLEASRTSDLTRSPGRASGLGPFAALEAAHASGERESKAEASVVNFQATPGVESVGAA